MRAQMNYRGSQPAWEKIALRLLQHIVFIAVNSYYLLSAMVYLIQRKAPARTRNGSKGAGEDKGEKWQKLFKIWTEEQHSNNSQ